MQLSNVDTPHPENYRTEETIESNGHFSLLLKEDGTYCLRNEFTGQENGRFLTEQEAKGFLTSIIDDENKGITKTDYYE